MNETIAHIANARRPVFTKLINYSLIVEKQSRDR